MKKNITTKKLANVVADMIENDLHTALGIYSEAPEVVARVQECASMDLYWTDIYVFNPNSGMLTSPEVETVQEVAKKYMRKYDDACVYYSLQTFPVWRDADRGFLDYPAIRVSVSKR